jgi:hypothetical protein
MHCFKMLNCTVGVVSGKVSQSIGQFRSAQETKEFVGYKIEYNTEKRSLKITQPVLLQSFEDEFNVASGHEVPKTPGIPYKALQLGAEPILEGEWNTYFRSGIGKLMHMRRWSRSELANALRDLSDTTLTVPFNILKQCIGQFRSAPSSHMHELPNA